MRGLGATDALAAAGFAGGLLAEAAAGFDPTFLVSALAVSALETVRVEAILCAAVEPGLDPDGPTACARLGGVVGRETTTGFATALEAKGGVVATTSTDSGGNCVLVDSGGALGKAGVVASAGTSFGGLSFTSA